MLHVHQVFNELLAWPVVALPMYDALDPLLARQEFLDQAQLALLLGALARLDIIFGSRVQYL